MIVLTNVNIQETDELKLYKFRYSFNKHLNTSFIIHKKMKCYFILIFRKYYHINLYKQYYSRIMSTFNTNKLKILHDVAFLHSILTEF